MSGVYDSWERVVDAVLNREHLRYLALCESFNSSISADFSSRFSFEDEITAFPGSSNTISLGVSSIHVQYIAFEEIKKATKNFRSYSDLGEGASGHFWKGWIDERTLTATKPGFGTAVAVKMWKGLEGLIDCLYIEFEELKKATKDFRSDSDLGGGFSLFCREWIHKHILLGSGPRFQSAVAVKMFKGLEGFNGCVREIRCLSRFHHPNIVKLIGYCYEDHMILVYEFISKGSLANHLFRGSHQTLPWATRIKVAEGAARGLAFLHRHEKPVLHLSFNTANIHLDEELNAKLCNFGSAMDGLTHDMTEGVGTFGHAAPKYVETGYLTEKSDVYSFGVVLVHLLSGGNTSVEWTEPYLRDERKLLQIMDPKLKGRFPHKAAYTVATIALQCLSQYVQMAEVVVALEQL